MHYYFAYLLRLKLLSMLMVWTCNGLPYLRYQLWYNRVRIFTSIFNSAITGILKFRVRYSLVERFRYSYISIKSDFRFSFLVVIKRSKVYIWSIWWRFYDVHNMMLGHSRLGFPAHDCVYFSGIAISKKRLIIFANIFFFQLFNLVALWNFFHFFISCTKCRNGYLNSCNRAAVI